MRLIDNLEDYKDCLNRARKKSSKIYNNIYLMPDDVKDFVKKKQLYIDENEYGCVMYVDEGTYYQLYICGDVSKKFPLEKKNKKCVVRDIYTCKRKSNERDALEVLLKENGYIHVSETAQVQGNTKDILNKCKSVHRYIEKLEAQGFVCKNATPDRFDEIDQMFIDSGIIKDYHLSYRTQEEKEALTPGSYMCIMKGDEICAASLMTVVNGMAQGSALVIKDSYKMKGLTPVMTYYREQWLYNMGVEHTQGWIVRTNTPSIQYHTSIGFEFTDKLADEWVLDSI